MAILATIFGLLGRFAGKVLTTTLGWASTLLFGRVPQDRQIVLVVVTFGSLVWVALVAGVLVPDVGTLLLAAVPVPSFVDTSWVRLAMLAGAIVLPLLIGGGAVHMRDPGERPTGVGLVREILRGYPLAVALAVTLAFLAVVAVVRRGRALAKRWASAHIPIVVQPGGYERLTADLEEALDAAGLDMTTRPAPAVLAMPARLLAAIAGAGVGALVPERLVELTGPAIEIVLHPSDIAIAGGEHELARARAAIASRLATSAAWLTNSEEAQKVEDRLRGLAIRGRRGDDVQAGFGEVDGTLANLTIPYEEWEVLYRIRLQVERDLLRGVQPGRAGPGRRAAAEIPQPAASSDRLDGALGAIGLALVAVDLVLAAVDRRRGRA